METYKKILIEGITLNEEYCGGFQNSYKEESDKWPDRYELRVDPIKKNPVRGLVSGKNKLPYSVKEQDLVSIQGDGPVEFVILVNNSGIPEANGMNRLKEAIGSSQDELIETLRSEIDRLEDKVSQLKDNLDEETDSKDSDKKSKTNGIKCPNCGANVSQSSLEANNMLCPNCDRPFNISKR